MRNQTQKLGDAGEELAAQFLLKKGYRILARNLKSRYGEIDILAEDGTTLVLVEVKTKSSLAYGQPYEMVGKQKQHKLILLAEDLAERHNMVDYRIDVVSIYLPADQNPTIEHFISAI